MKSENRFSQGIKDSIPIALGYIGVSFSFGILAVSKGLDIWAAVLMSFSNLTSAGQFAGLNLIINGCMLLELIITQFVINLRYSLMSVTLSQKVDGTVTTPHRLLTSFFITDEIFAVAASKKTEVGCRYLYGLGLLPLLGWTFGTFLGGLAGSVLPLAIRSALGIALFGMFIAIIIPPAKEQKSVRIVILVSVILSCVLSFTPVLKEISSGFVIIICAIVASLVGAIFFPVKEDDDI